MVASETSQRKTASPGLRRVRVVEACSIALLLLASAGIGSGAASASAASNAGPSQLIGECNADAKTVGIGVAAEEAVNPGTYPGRHGRATSTTWRTALLSSGSGGPWLRSWPGLPHAYSITVAGTSAARTSGDHTAPVNGDVLVHDDLNGKVYDATVDPAGSCVHFAFSLKLTPSPGPTAAHAILASLSAGFSALPPGTFNGSLSEASLSSLGLYPGIPAYDELQAAGSSDYLRTWRSPDGAIGITVFQMKSPAAAARLTHEDGGTDSKGYRVTAITTPAVGYLWVDPQLHVTSFGTAHVVGYVVHDRSYTISVVGELATGSDARTVTTSVLDRQVARLNHLLPSSSASSLLVIAGAVAAALLALLLLLLAIGRTRSRRRAGSLASPTSAASSGADRLRTAASATTTASAPPSTAPAARAPEPSASYFCSWCGTERQRNADSVHHCGSRDRPPVYCSACGKELGEAECSCGVLATQLSPPH